MSNIDRLVSLVHDALADEVYDGGSGALTEQELHNYTHTLARTAVEALTAVEMEGAEEFEREPNRAVATAGELATIWNAATPEHRQNMTDVIMARQDMALSCFMEDHEGALAQLEARANRYIDIVFDRLPDQEGANFVEVEDQTGASIKVGTWVTRSDGFVALRIEGV